MRHLAERLLAAEGADPFETQRQAHAGVRVCEKLRISLSRFAGPDGFSALMRRALALARSDSPSLQAVTLRPDGSIEGLESLSAESADAAAEAIGALISHLLQLLVTFIGEPLTLRLVSDAWPDAKLDE